MNRRSQQLQQSKQERAQVAAARTRLSHRLDALKANLSQQPDFESTISTLSQTREERDALLDRLSSIARDHLTFSPPDIAAHYVLYLTESLRENEQWVDAVEKAYAEATCGTESIIPPGPPPGLNDWRAMPAKVEQLKGLVALTASVRTGLRRDLIETRSRLGSAAHAIPQRVFALEGQFRALDEEIAALERRAIFVEKENARERRTAECQRERREWIANALAESGVPEGAARQAVEAIRSIFRLADSPNASDQLFQAHAKAFVHICAPLTGNIPGTPAAIRPPRVSATPQNPSASVSELRARIEARGMRSGPPKETRSPDQVRRALAVVNGNSPFAERREALRKIMSEGM
jgi:hypothetical protein